MLVLKVHEAMRAAVAGGATSLQCSLDLDRSTTSVEIDATHWSWQGQRFPYLESCKERTIYHWDGAGFRPVSRYAGALIKLVPTQWGPPTFEIDGIKMLPTSKVSPYADAQSKVALIKPRGKVILDTCGGLGYFASWCLQGEAARVFSYEKNADVIWLRGLNPWSPQIESADVAARLSLTHGDIAEHIVTMTGESVDAILHDPPRFGIAGELYSQAFYDQLARVMRRRGMLFHYTGTPNKLTSGRDVPNEVARRLQKSGFAVKLHGDGVLAVKSSR